MAASHAIFAGAIPALYDRLLGPGLFNPYADDLARRVAGFDNEAVLETACGTGILTHALTVALPPAVRIVATDLNQPMLDQAATKPELARVALRQADAQALPFPDAGPGASPDAGPGASPDAGPGAGFDTVVCQFGVMFFPDRIAGFREARRVLKPGGRFLFNVWGPLSHNPVTELIVRALAERFPDNPPSFFAKVPFAYHDVSRIRDDLRAAGFADMSAETVDLQVPLASPRDVVVGLCQGTPVRAEIEARDPGGLVRVTEAVADYVMARLGERTTNHARPGMDATSHAMRALVVTARP
jgi:ubiquinone/menaquinone biosynthesis C-methylase UbiE